MRSTSKAGIALIPLTLITGLFVGHAAATGNGPNAPVAGRPSGVSARATVPQRVFAVVASDGTKTRGKAVASTTRTSTGVYDVRFNRNITQCAWNGTVGVGSTPFGGSEPDSSIVVSGRSGTNNGLFVQTFNQSGGATDLPFLVVVICG